MILILIKDIKDEMQISNSFKVHIFQKTQKFINDQRRFNMHIAIYYKIMMRKYEMFNNLNILIEKNKHR